MSLKVKAVQTDLNHLTDAKGNKLGTRFVLKPELYSKLNEAKVIKEAALRSGVSKGVMQACWDAAGEVIKAWATEGHSVALPGLGTMRFGLRSKSVENVNKVASDLIQTRRIIFTPDVDLKNELKQTSISITCYDAEGNVIKRVTSEDAGTVEDNEDENGTTSDGTTGNGTTDNGSNGSSTGDNGENSSNGSSSSSDNNSGTSGTSETPGTNAGGGDNGGGDPDKASED